MDKPQVREGAVSGAKAHAIPDRQRGKNQKIMEIALFHALATYQHPRNSPTDSCDVPQKHFRITRFCFPKLKSLNLYTGIKTNEGVVPDQHRHPLSRKL